MARRQVHESQSLQTALLLQDMYRSQEALCLQEHALVQVESLIRRIRSGAGGEVGQEE